MKKRLILTLLALLTVVSFAHAGNRIALVIGNSNYKNSGLSYLPNPVKDAALMKETLEQLGFRVIYAENLNKESMDNIVDQFIAALSAGDIAFFYYAGHGSSYAGKSYLLPLGANIRSATQFKYRANNAQEVLDLMSEKAKSSILVLDACRDTPFSRSVGTRGLASINSGKGTYVIYAADQGQAALDNRIFAKSLSRALLKPQSIQDVALETRQKVLAASDGAQYPATYDKLLERVFLNGRQSQQSATQVADITPQPMPQHQNTGKRIGHYIAYANGTALDTKTNLLWQRCSVGETWKGSNCTGEPKEYTWDEAMQLSSTLAGYSDWRLPTIDELGTLVYCSSGKTKGDRDDDPGRSAGCAGNYHRPTIHTTVFPMQKQYYYWSEEYKAADKEAWWRAYYWSSSPDADPNDRAWSVNFNGGYDSSSLKYVSNYVRLVRDL